MGLLDLWLPILVPAAVMYVASTLIWVVFKWHNADYNKLNDEEAARAGLRGNKPGFYLLPDCGNRSVRCKQHHCACSGEHMVRSNFLDALIYALLTGGVFGWLVHRFRSARELPGSRTTHAETKAGVSPSQL